MFWGFLTPSLCSVYTDRKLGKAGRNLHLSIHSNESTWSGGGAPPVRRPEVPAPQRGPTRRDHRLRPTGGGTRQANQTKSNQIKF